MAQEYPVTRLQAAKWLRKDKGKSISILIPSSSGKTEVIALSLKNKKIIVTVVYGIKINLNWKQTLGLLRRNYVRSYMDLV